MVKEKDKELGKFVLLGIWFDSAEVAEWVLDNGFLVDQRYIRSVERYKVKRKRYFRY